jgi:GDP-4-dehydro-6-deoxy-D-mannose reductase
VGLQEPVLHVGNLEARRDFLDVRDVARAYLLAIQRARPGTVYNVGSGTTHSVRDVLDQLLAHTSTPIEVRYDPARGRPADLPLLLADATRFRVATGWRPTIPLATTTADILAEWRQRARAERAAADAQGGSP